MDSLDLDKLPELSRRPSDDVPELFIAVCPFCGYNNDVFVSKAELERESGMVGVIMCARGESRFASTVGKRLCGQRFAVFIE